jgi:hypothetical protein
MVPSPEEVQQEWMVEGDRHDRQMKRMIGIVKKAKTKRRRPVVQRGLMVNTYPDTAACTPQH